MPTKGAKAKEEKVEVKKDPELEERAARVKREREEEEERTTAKHVKAEQKPSGDYIRCIYFCTAPVFMCIGCSAGKRNGDICQAVLGSSGGIFLSLSHPRPPIPACLPACL